MPLTYALAALNPDAMTLRLSLGDRVWALGVNLWPPRVRLTRDWLAELRRDAKVADPSDDPTLRAVADVCGPPGVAPDAPPVVADSPRLEMAKALGGKVTGEEWGFSDPDAAARIAGRACDDGHVDGLLCLNNEVARFAASAVRHRVNPSAATRADAINLATRAAAQLVTLIRQLENE